VFVNVPLTLSWVGLSTPRKTARNGVVPVQPFQDDEVIVPLRVFDHFTFDVCARPFWIRWRLPRPGVLELDQVANNARAGLLKAEPNLPTVGGVERPPVEDPIA